VTACRALLLHHVLFFRVKTPDASMVIETSFIYKERQAYDIIKSKRLGFLLNCEPMDGFS
jgi:hypothetical protein